MKEKTFISLVVAVRKQDDPVLEFLEWVDEAVSSRFEHYEFICVCREDADAAVEQIRAFKRRKEQIPVSILTMNVENGLETVMNAGADFAIGDFIYEFDSCYIDYPQSLLADVYEKAMEGCDIVCAVPPKRASRWTSRLFYRVYNQFSYSGIALCTERFHLISRRAVNRIGAYSKMVPYRKAVYSSSGLKISQVAYSQSEERIGKPGIDIRRNDTAMDALVLFTDFAYRISLLISILMAVFMVMTGIYTAVVYFSTHRPVEGWAPLMGLISLGFCAVFLIQTMIIKYLDVLLKLVFRRKKYMISSVDRL